MFTAIWVGDKVQYNTDNGRTFITDGAYLVELHINNFPKYLGYKYK